MNKSIKSNGPVVKSKYKKSVVVQQEIRFAKMLAGNDKNKRVKMLKKLRSWITVRSSSSFAFTETDFMRLWKGLFYCMWMSDKPLVQEELAEAISQLVHCIESLDTAILYTTCALKTLSAEWFGIDYWRLDKFEMLVRRIVRQTFVMCKKRSWDKEWTKAVAQVVETALLDPKGSMGFKFHVTELYMEELAKISDGKIPEDLVTELIKPFAIYLATITDGRQIKNVMRHIFRYLIFQSDIGIDYLEKFKAWKQAGFPTGNIDAMKKVELSDEETDEEDLAEESNEAKPLDPRHGRVDVELPQVPFNARQIVDLIQQYKFHESSSTKTRRQITRLIREFSELAKGSMPIGIKQVRLPHPRNEDTNPKLAALKLVEFDDDLYADSKRRMKRKMDKASENPIDNSSDLEETEVKEKKVIRKRAEFQIKNKAKEASENGINGSSDLEETEVKKRKMVTKPAENQLNSKTQRCIKNKAKEAFENGINGSIDLKEAEVKKRKIVTKPAENQLNSKIQRLMKKKIKKASEKTLVTDFSESGNELQSEKKIRMKKKTRENGITTSSDDLKESVVKKRKIDTKTSIGKIPWLLPIVKKLELEKSPKTPIQNLISTASGSSAKKRVQIVLQKNTAQNRSEYIRQLRLSPAIPFDANKKPPAGVLKPSPLSSPINPFYKRL